jgi:hypothetical protein
MGCHASAARRLSLKLRVAFAIQTLDCKPLVIERESGSRLFGKRPHPGTYLGAKLSSAFLIVGFSRVFRAFLPHLRVRNRLRSNYARVALQDLLQVLRERRARHHDVGAGLLRLLFKLTLHMR